jgi:hypothetical protein
MRSKPPIPQSQKNITRMAARSAWKDNTEAEKAKDDAIARIETKVVWQWQDEARQLASELIDHWNKRGILEPQATYVLGEPGCEQWDEG